MNKNVLLNIVIYRQWELDALLFLSFSPMLVLVAPMQFPLLTVLGPLVFRLGMPLLRRLLRNKPTQLSIMQTVTNRALSAGIIYTVLTFFSFLLLDYLPNTLAADGFLNCGAIIYAGQIRLLFQLGCLLLLFVYSCYHLYYAYQKQFFAPPWLI